MCSEALVSDNKPKEVELIAGKEYYYCRCGRSANEPFCDGSHKGSGCVPFCDGSHSMYSAKDIGKKVKI